MAGQTVAVATVTVADPEAGERLDRVLAAHLDLSRSRLKALILAGEVAVGGRTIRDPGHRVNSGDAIRVSVPPPEPAAPRAEAIPLVIVYEDDAVIVIDKPAGLVVHPAAGNETGTLVNALIAHCGASLSGIGGVKRPGIVHRLDKDTSGLMVVAKSDRAHRVLSRQFADHGRTGALTRGYLASCGARRTGRAARSMRRSTATRARARSRRCARAGARRSPTGRCWNAMPGPTAGRSRACWRAGWRPAARTRSASISPTSAIRCWATPSTGPASRLRRRIWRRARGRRSMPLADRRSMPISWASTTRTGDSWSSARNCRSIWLVYVMSSPPRGMTR
jgi:23S rRNA-/tRNA-specific pseudouridylate synthase